MRFLGFLSTVVLLSACDFLVVREAGTADFFPLEEGNVWVFDYTAHSSGLFFGSVREAGTFTITFGEVTDNATGRVAQATEHRRGLKIASSPRGDGSIVYDTTAHDESRAIVFEETEEGVSIPWSLGILPRYHAAETDTVRLSAGQYWRCNLPDTSATLTTAGLVAYSASCGFSSGSHSLYLTRTE